MILLIYPFIIFAKPVINNKIEYYYIYPDSKKDLRRALFAKTPIVLNGKKYLGVTRWRIYLDYEILKKGILVKQLILKLLQIS